MPLSFRRKKRERDTHTGARILHYTQQWRAIPQLLINPLRVLFRAAETLSGLSRAYLSVLFSGEQRVGKGGYEPKRARASESGQTAWLYVATGVPSGARVRLGCAHTYTHAHTRTRVRTRPAEYAVFQKVITLLLLFLLRPLPR